MSAHPSLFKIDTDVRRLRRSCVLRMTGDCQRSVDERERESGRCGEWARPDQTVWSVARTYVGFAGFTSRRH